jgi:hypothetical protein
MPRSPDHPMNLAGPLGFGLHFKGSVASDFALASGSRDQALTIRLTDFRSPDHGDHPLELAGPLGFEPRQSAPKALDLPLVDGPKIKERHPDGRITSTRTLQRASRPEGPLFTRQKP